MDTKMHSAFIGLVLLAGLTQTQAAGAAVTITTQPTNQAVSSGATATFSVVAAGAGPLAYQWQFNGTNLPGGIITTVAGGDIGDGSVAASASLNEPGGVAVDGFGNLFIADSDNQRVRRVGANGIITTVAGNGNNAYLGDLGPAINASLNNPQAVAVDATGDLFIADAGNNVIRKVDTGGIIMTVAGGGTNYPGDGGEATNASLNNPLGVSVDASGNLYIADFGNNIIRRVGPNGIITTVAGNGTNGYSGDGGVATNASLNNPSGVAVDASGCLLIADSGNNIIRRVDTNGTITTVAGGGIEGLGDDGSATNASLSYPTGVAVNASGDLFIADSGNNRIREVGANGLINTIAGGYSGDVNIATDASLNNPEGVAVDASGNLFIADSGDNRILELGKNGSINTTAGGYIGDGGPVAGASLNDPLGVAVDPAESMFIADSRNNLIRKVDTNGIITAVAGNGNNSFTGDGGAATNASLSNPKGVTMDAAGNLFIADSSNQRVRKVATNGIITTVAGNGNGSYSGDGVQATNASVWNPVGVAVDPSGNLFISDYFNARIRKVGTNGIISTVAGGGTNYPGNGGQATNASLSYPQGVALDAAGNLFIADSGNNVIRRVGTNGIITIVAGAGTNYPGNGGQATNASLNNPTGVALDASGNLFIADSGNNVIRKVGTNGIITTVAGGGPNYLGDGGAATNASLSSPQNVTVDGSGNLLIADAGNSRIRQVSSSSAPSLTLRLASLNNAGSYNVIITNSSGSATSLVATLAVVVEPVSQSIDMGASVTFSVTVAGPAPLSYAWYENGASIAGATNASYTTNNVPLAGSASQFFCVISDPSGSVTSSVVVLTVGSPPVITTEPTNQAVTGGGTATFSVAASGTGPLTYQWQFNGINLPAGIITTVAGGDIGDHSAATSASLNAPQSVAVDESGDLFITDCANQRIRKVGANGIITTVAGNGSIGYSGDTGAAINASMSTPQAVAVDASGNLFIADSGNNVVRKVDTHGIITTVAGNGNFGYSGDGGAATNAVLNYPNGLAVDAAGNLFIADHYNQRIRKVGANGIITTVAGNGTPGYTGDGIPATDASLNYPTGVALDASGNLFIADYVNCRIRKVGLNGIITTVAGNGTNNYAGDGGPATKANLNNPQGVAVDASGELFIADSGNNVVRKVNANGIITTWAGNQANQGYLGDGGEATNASLNYPTGLAAEPSGNLFIADSGDNRIREVGANGLINTVAGGFLGVGLPATEASLNNPLGAAVDAFENLFVADSGNNLIREVGASGIITTVAGNGTNGYAGDGGAATSASLNNPQGEALDASGNLFIADSGNNVIRRVGTNGIIMTVAGGGTNDPGDGGEATNASLNNPVGVALDASGNLFISDYYNQRIRKVGVNGIITTVAGNGANGYSGDGGAATNAKLFNPQGVALDPSGNLFIADSGNNVIRRVDANGIITTVAGDAQNPGYSGDGGTATFASLGNPTGVSVDAAGDLFIADNGNNVIRRVDASGIITTVAGDGNVGYSGDGAAAINASLNAPQMVVADGSGNLLIADAGNNRIRQVSSSSAPALTLRLANLNNAGSYDVVVTSPFGSVTGSVATLLVSGSLQVTMDPPDAIILGAEWQVDGNGLWQTNGAMVTNLPVGAHTVSFKPIPGWNTPSNQTVAITYDAATSATGVYTLLGTATSGALSVELLPIGAANAGAQWQVQNGPKQNSGAIVSNLPAGIYLLSFTSLAGSNTPPDQEVAIINGVTTWASGIYTTANATTTNEPTLLTNGYGTIQRIDWPSTMVIGKPYKVKAMPKAGNLFAGWVGGTNQPTNVLSASASYTFTNQTNLVLEANFVTNVFLKAQGTYQGLFGPTNPPVEQAGCGSFTFRLTSSGGVSGSFDLAGQTMPFSGKFGRDGTTSVVARPPRGEPALTAALQLDFADQSVSGTVGNASFTAQLNGDRAVFSGSDKASAFAGQYTLIIPGATDSNTGPFGVSWGSVKVDDSGNIRLTGSLADNTAISQSSVVSKDGLWPLYVSLYGGKGSLWGWNYLTNGTIANAYPLSWINATNSSKTALYRSGFTNQEATLTGALYHSTAALPTNLTAYLEGGNLPHGITNGVTISASDKISLTNKVDENNKLTLSITKSTGVLSGTFANPAKTNQKIKVGGVILQLPSQTNAQGYFLGANQSGTFTLGPP